MAGAYTVLFGYWLVTLYRGLRIHGGKGARRGGAYNRVIAPTTRALVNSNLIAYIIFVYQCDIIIYEQ